MVFPQPDAPLRGKKVVLRPWEPADAVWYVDARDEEVFRWTTEPRTLTAAQVQAAIAANRSAPTYVGLVITDAATGALAGNIALTLPDPSCARAEVMYWLAAEARGRGFATDAVRALTVWAFDALPIAEIELLTNQANQASQRVAMRCGFTPSGTRGERALFVVRRGALDEQEVNEP